MLQKIKKWFEPQESDAFLRLNIQLKEFILKTGSIPEFILLSPFALCDLKNSRSWLHWVEQKRGEYSIFGIKVLIAKRQSHIFELKEQLEQNKMSYLEFNAKI